MASEAGVTIQITDKAVAYIRSRRLTSPAILMNLVQRSAGGGDGCGDGCGGGGCGEGGSGSQTVAAVNTILVDAGQPGSGFVKVDTAAGIPAYMSKAAYEMARGSQGALVVNVKGLVMKRLVLEGLGTASGAGESHGHQC